MALILSSYSPQPPFELYVGFYDSSTMSSRMDGMGVVAGNATTTTFVSFLLGTLYALNIVISFLGNLMVIIAVATTHKLKTITNYLLISLAVADLTVTVGGQ